jgi:hypothetical protein
LYCPGHIFSTRGALQRDRNSQKKALSNHTSYRKPGVNYDTSA